MSATLPFLFEIGVEEIPHWMIPVALENLRSQFSTLLEQNRLPAAELRMDATPRRLVLRTPALAVRQEDREELVMGPPKAAGEGAAHGFARKQGVDASALRVETTAKGEYFAVVKKTEGRQVRDILAEALPNLITRIPWPKTMYWTGKDGPRFIRPVRWIVALLGDQVVEFEFAGIHSRTLSCGHRRYGSDEIAFDYANYEDRLEKNGVILSVEARKKRILDGIRKLLRGKGLRLVEDAALLDDLAYLTEYPTPILGNFDPRFLELPREVLTTVMRHHQRYFSLVDADGKLAPHFIAVMNMKADRKGLVQKGNERVLEARFNDARFFWEVDQKRPLRDRIDDLKAVTFQAQLGSYREKTAGVASGAERLATRLGLDRGIAIRAAELSKTDLTTEMVKEFTDLQGVIGGLYAKAQGEPEEVWRAIYEHYQPASMEADIPVSKYGQVLSIADKLDTLEGCFSIGLVPTGSKDPLGLRRAAQGVVKVLAEGGLRIDFRQAVLDGCRETQRILSSRGAAEARRADGTLEFAAQLLEFFEDRIRYYFRDVRGFAYDEVTAALAGDWKDLVDLENRLHSLRRVRQTENFEPLAAAFKRIRNILKQANWTGGEVNAALLEAGAERDLFNEYQEVEREVRRARHNDDYLLALSTIAALRPAVDRFFDSVMVNVENPALRANRLALLGRMLNEVSSIADFSEIVPTTTTNTVSSQTTGSISGE